MSTGCHCLIVEYRPGQWYYVLERGSAPKCSWDWREYADAYGPFPTADAAINNLDRNHANPGGWCQIEYTPELDTDTVLGGLVAVAYAPRRDGSVRSPSGTIINGPFILVGRGA